MNVATIPATRSSMTGQQPLRIVILGGGFAGMAVARTLERKVGRNAEFEVHLVNNENYVVFQPLLPEVVSCGIEPSHILNPIRQLCRRLHFHCASVETIDTAQQTVSIVGTDKRIERTLHYDHLVIALGLTIDLSRNPGMTEHSLPIKTLGDAFHLRNHVLSKLEEADIETDPVARKRLLTVVAVGGGFSGVETVAEINDMIKSVLKFYPRNKETGPRIILVHSRDRILNELSPGLAQFAQRKLAQRGVDIMLNCRVSEATPDGLTLSDGRTIPAGTVICTVGNAPHPLIRSLSLPQERGRLLVDEFMRVNGQTNIWALGDSALVPDIRRGGHCPPTAQYAMRQGKICAANLLAASRGKPVKAFSFGGLGQLAVIGHRCGVADVMGMKIAGVLAWWLWRSVYWSKLPGVRCKLRVALDWTIDLVFPRDITKLALDRTDQLRRAHFRAGDDIIKFGELGDRFYIIESGEVEVLEPQPDGSERRVATRSAGDSFGEIALVQDSRRNATVRCLTPVDVVTFTRRDFQTLIGSYDVLKRQIAADVQERST